MSMYTFIFLGMIPESIRYKLNINVMAKSTQTYFRRMFDALFDDYAQNPNRRTFSSQMMSSQIYRMRRPKLATPQKASPTTRDHCQFHFWWSWRTSLFMRHWRNVNNQKDFSRFNTFQNQFAFAICVTLNELVNGLVNSSQPLIGLNVITCGQVPIPTFTGKLCW